MKKKKEAVKTAATVIDGKKQMQLDLGASTLLKIHYTPQPGSIASFLLTGRENAQTAKELCRTTGMPFRVVTKRIQEERLNGAPILSSPDRGYWLPEDATEVLRCAADLHNRAKSIHATATALRKSLKV